MGRRFAVITVAIPIAATMICNSVSSSASANDIVDEWGRVTPPPAPGIKPVRIDPKTTALLMLDFVQHDPYCGDRKPRCGATLPAMKRLLSNARMHGTVIIYSVAGKY